MALFPKPDGAIRVMLVFGTRPEAIKMAPVVHALAADPSFQVTTVVTAQHREMLDQVLAVFGLRPEYDLGLMRAEQTLGELTGRVLAGLEEPLRQVAPSLVLVHGDTTTTFAASLAAFYHRIPVGHVEAGLRTGDRYQPYPEEMNRRLTAALAEIHFAPTARAAANLAAEGIAADRVFVTGNTVVDALHQCRARLEARGITKPRSVVTERPYLLVTVHRRESWGERLAGICRAISRVLADHPELDLVMPVHLNPIVQATVRGLLEGGRGVHLLPPVEYDEMVLLMSGAHLVLTDSGGIQEEAPALGLPVLVLRQTTERPEAVAAGTVVLAGTAEEEIYRLARRILEDKALYARMARAVNPYGDGRAAPRIREALLHSFGLVGARPQPFIPAGDGSKAREAGWTSPRTKSGSNLN